ncbi:MAG: hypothetical protein JSU00_29080 [Acidobacteria bacterium]|nr:hypothetical protein [Acidobacteriota bacterium]
MTRSVLFMALPALLFASDPGGLRPRSSPGDYPASETGKVVAIGAAVLTPDQAKAAFSTDLREYVVVEVGLFPEAGQVVDVSAMDFALRVGARGELVRAANPRAIAASNQRKANPPPSRASDITVYPTATVGYESGDVYDPATGRRRGGGWYGGTGVAVATGDPGYPQPPRPAGTDRDREVMNQELADKTLPETTTNQPISGYLYFRIAPKMRTSALELQYLGKDDRVRVLLPALKK